LKVYIHEFLDFFNHFTDKTVVGFEIPSFVW